MINPTLKLSYENISGMKNIIKKIVIATAQWSVLSFFYDVYYNIALEVSIYCLKKIPEVSWIFVKRSFSGSGWIAGYSDIDLEIVIKPLTPAAEVLVLTKVHKTLCMLKILFPVLSAHIFCLNEIDFVRWLSYGNIRRLEFSRWVKRHG